MTLDKTTLPLDTIGFAFTPTFLTEHVHFNPGAIVDNASCYGQSPIIASNVQGVLQAAGVGRYLGWTKAVDGNDADVTDAFLFDRMLGEQSPQAVTQSGLSGFINQRTPPQRPFRSTISRRPWGRKRATARSPGRRTNLTRCPTSTSRSTRRRRRLPTERRRGSSSPNFGGEDVANPVIEYGLPSISHMSVVESPSYGTLTIYGRFPPESGNVQITDGSGTTSLAPRLGDGSRNRDAAEERQWLGGAGASFLR